MATCAATLDTSWQCAGPGLAQEGAREKATTEEDKLGATPWEAQPRETAAPKRKRRR